MLATWITKLTVWLLSWIKLSIQNRTLLTAQILSSLQALPLKDIITLDEEGNILVQGRRLKPEQELQLREAARGTLSNQARKLVHDQVLFRAVALGVHTVTTPEQMYFSRAAIWFGQQEIELLKILAKSNEDGELSLDD